MNMAHNPYKSPENDADLPQKRSNLPAIALRVGIVIGIVGVVVAMLLPARRTGGREAMRRMQCSNHLKQIAAALQNYHDAFGAFPPAYTVAANGKPLHSWRTLILPFLKNKPLYDRIDLSRPWDDPVNRFAYDTIVSTYHCPSASSKVPKGQTTYLGVAAPGGFFQGAQPRPMTAMTDGSSNTLMVIEVGEEHAVHWMSPSDATEDLILNRGANGKFSHPNGGLAAFADGHTQHLSKSAPAEVLRAIISIAGNDNEIAANY